MINEKKLKEAGKRLKSAGITLFVLYGIVLLFLVSMAKELGINSYLDKSFIFITILCAPLLMIAWDLFNAGKAITKSVEE